MRSEAQQQHAERLAQDRLSRLKETVNEAATKKQRLKARAAAEKAHELRLIDEAHETQRRLRAEALKRRGMAAS